MRESETSAYIDGSHPGFSVVICCYNSTARLPKTLEALAKQQLPAVAKFALEILVVDNASEDDTYAVAEGLLLAPEFPHVGRVISQKRPGKSYALELGLSEARYDYILIVDDDNWLDYNYLSIAFDRMTTNAQIAVLGGVGSPVSEVPFPSWFNQFAIDFAAAPQALRSGDVTQSNYYLYGAGMVLRKSAWELVRGKGFQSLITEVRGTKPSGEDNEMCYALILAGYKIWYDSELHFCHFIPAGRLTWAYLQRTYRANAVSEVELLPWMQYLQLKHSNLHEKIKNLFWLRNGAYMLKYMIRYLIRSLRNFDLGKEGSSNSIRVMYYWNAFKQCIKKEINLDTSFSKIENYIKNIHQ